MDGRTMMMIASCLAGLLQRDRTRARARQLKKELTSTSIPIADYRKQQEEEAGEDGQPKVLQTFKTCWLGGSPCQKRKLREGGSGVGWCCMLTAASAGGGLQHGLPRELRVRLRHLPVGQAPARAQQRQAQALTGRWAGRRSDRLTGPEADDGKPREAVLTVLLLLAAVCMCQLPWTYEGDKYSFVSVTAVSQSSASQSHRPMEGWMTHPQAGRHTDCSLTAPTIIFRTGQ